MKKIRPTLIKVFFLLCCLEVAAQGGGINNISMTPLSPTQNDSITFIVDVGFPSGACMTHYNELSYYYDSIVYVSSYCYGTFYYICQHIDSILILPLSPGNYIFHYSLHSYSSMSDCPFFYPVDSVDINFSVINSMGLIDDLHRNDLFNIFSTDYSNNLVIHLNSSIIFNAQARLTVTNLLGQKVYEDNIAQSEYALNMKNSAGIYFVTLELNGLYQTKKIFIKNNH